MSGPATLHHAGASKAQIYRPRRPAATLLHKVVRENLDSYLVSGAREDGLAPNTPFHIQAAFREYLKCGISAHGFARVYCAGCGHDFLIPFSCKGRDVCPSCAMAIWTTSLSTRWTPRNTPGVGRWMRR